MSMFQQSISEYDELKIADTRQNLLIKRKSRITIQFQNPNSTLGDNKKMNF